MAAVNDTICALATPAGRGGVSIIRISGQKASELCLAITGCLPPPYHAQVCSFKHPDTSVIDQGLVLYFKSPHSFTGEDVCELHTHGSPVVTDMILKLLLGLGARLAKPGEFSERAFLNDKIDLAQAEAIADLINSASISAAQFAIRSLQGEFSRLIHILVEKLTGLRIYIEAAMDFPDEEVDFLNDGDVAEKLSVLRAELDSIMLQAKQGSLVREGIRVVIAGEPNAGKSTLLNMLSGEDHAIVTNIPGTTRDVLQQTINIDGLPIHILDTAGIRSSEDPVEQEGIRRAWQAIKDADLILLINDFSKLANLNQNYIWNLFTADAQYKHKLLLLLNKIDLTEQSPGILQVHDIEALAISASQGLGIDLLRNKLKEFAGFTVQEEGGFIARRRHIVALEQAINNLQQAQIMLASTKSGELVAEELRRAQNALGEITGKVSSDDLLGKIFSSFCIGK